MMGHELLEVLTEYQKNLYAEWVQEADFFAVGKKTTVCLLTLSNGFEIIGTSACVDPKNFDATIGKEYALKSAIEELDKHVGFYRQVKLSGEGK